ncbi:MAG: peptidylprolyl isomerase [Rhodospirillales bacterium]|nr:peptidylprolyl isomerase [Rhodospirillales bacterium]
MKRCNRETSLLRGGAVLLAAFLLGQPVASSHAASPGNAGLPIGLPGAAPAVGAPGGSDIRPNDIRGAGPVAPGDSAPLPATSPSSGLPAGITGAGPTNPMVATIEGHAIYLNDVGQAVQQMPPALRSLPFQSVYPALLDRLVDRAALVIAARREHLDDDPEVRRQIDHILEQAYLRKAVLPDVTEAAIRALYQKDFAGKGPVQQAHARHILVASKAQAEDLIKQLDHGADFAALAHKFSQDPSGAKGGDLGWFSARQVDPAFAKVVFALKPGEIAQTPMENAFGWHVVQLLGLRTVDPPSFAAIHDKLREQLIEELSRKVAAKVRQGMIIHEYNLDGSPLHYQTPEEKAAAADTTGASSATPENSQTQ